MPIPDRPKIYHIAHVDNLASIYEDGYLWSDSEMVQRQGGTVIGMANIKQRRITLPVSCHPGTCVGEYVPFYFCPRSVMLFVIHCANHPELAYQGGQQPIVHLAADMYEVAEWAEANGRLWAFSLSNASAVYTRFCSDLARLNEINWDAVAARNFQSEDVKESKQAEFLVQRSFPWQLVERIGVQSQEIAQRVYAAMSDAGHRPRVEIRREWYY